MRSKHSSTARLAVAACMAAVVWSSYGVAQAGLFYDLDNSNGMPNGVNSIALSSDVGDAAVANGVSSTAIGDGATAQGDNTVALGKATKAIGENSAAYGNKSEANGVSSVALGDTAVSNGEGSIVAGRNAVVSRDASRAIALGSDTGGFYTNTQADSVDSVAIGTKARIFLNSANGIAIGTNASVGTGNYYPIVNGATGTHGDPLGPVTQTGENSIAIGNSSIVNANNAVAIGNKANSYGISSVTIGDNSVSAYHGVAVGGNAKTNSLGDVVAIGYDAEANSSGRNGTAVGSGAKVLTQYGVALGYSSVTGDAVATTSVADNGITYNGFAGTNPGAVVSVGGNAIETFDATRQIQNVSAGRISNTSTDAINGSQLYSVIKNAEWKTNVGGNVESGSNTTDTEVHFGDAVNFNGGQDVSIKKSVSTDGHTTTYTIHSTLGSNTLSLGGDNQTSTNTQALNKNGGLSFDIVGTTTGTGASAKQYVTTKASGDKVEIDLTQYAKDKIEAATAASAPSTVSVNGGSSTVADGATGGAGTGNLILTESQNASNGNHYDIQLSKDLKGINSTTYATNGGGTTVINGGGITINPASNVDNNGNVVNPQKSVSVTEQGLNNGGNVITNVAPGVNDTDVVNKGQLDEAVNKVSGAGIAEAHRAGAHAAALAALKPLQYDPLEPTQFMAGVGNYRGETAAAVGLAHFTKEHTMFHAGIALGHHHNMVNAGVTRKFGWSPEKKAVPDRYKAGPISSVYVMQDEITALKAMNEKVMAKNEELEKENQTMKAQLAKIMDKLGI